MTIRRCSRWRLIDPATRRDFAANALVVVPGTALGWAFESVDQLNRQSLYELLPDPGARTGPALRLLSDATQAEAALPGVVVRLTVGGTWVA